MFGSTLLVRIPRIFTIVDLQASTQVALDADACKHVKDVLRLKPGHQVILFNGQGFDYHGEITAVKKRHINVAVNDRTRVDNESSIKIHLLQPLCRSDKMDWCVQKATELGVQQITPFISQRVNVQIPPERLAKKMHHWTAVAASACEQSGRARLPRLDAPQLFSHVIDSAAPEDAKFIAVPGSAETIAAAANDQSIDCCVCLIGPEGGFTNEETNLAEKTGFKTISLGPRILRLETAVVATITLMQSRWGDMH